MSSAPPALPDVDAMKAAHSKRTKALVGNVSALEAEVKALRNAHKEHKRSSYISALQAHLHDRELVIDVLKQGWAEASGKSLADVNEYVSRKTVGGPKRFRPKTREEMALELQAQATEIESLRAQLRKQGGDEVDARKGDRAAAKTAATVAQQIAEALQPVREQVKGLEAAVEARQAQIRELQLQIRSYADVEAQAYKLAQAHLKTKDALSSLQAAHEDLAASHAAVRRRGGEGGAARPPLATAPLPAPASCADRRGARADARARRRHRRQAARLARGRGRAPDAPQHPHRGRRRRGAAPAAAPFAGADRRPQQCSRG